MPLVPVLNFMPLCSAPGATAIMLSAIIASGNRNPINRSIHTTLYFASTILPRHSADAMTQNPYLFLYSPDPTDAQNWDALYGPEIYARISFHCFAVATRRANPIRRSMTSSEAARWVSIQVSFRPRRCSFYAQKSRLTGGARPPSGCGLTARIADSSSKNAVSFSSARTTKRFPSPRCASAIQIVRQRASMAGHVTQTPTGFFEIVGNDFPVVLHVITDWFPSLFAMRSTLLFLRAS